MGSKSRLKFLLEAQDQKSGKLDASSFCSQKCFSCGESFASRLLSTSTFSRPGARKLTEPSTSRSIDTFIDLLSSQATLEVADTPETSLEGVTQYYYY